MKRDWPYFPKLIKDNKLQIQESVSQKKKIYKGKHTHRNPNQIV